MMEIFHGLLRCSGTFIQKCTLHLKNRHLKTPQKSVSEHHPSPLFLQYPKHFLGIFIHGVWGEHFMVTTKNLRKKCSAKNEK